MTIHDPAGPEDLTADERQLLGGMPGEIEPPHPLEDRLLARLRSRGLVRPPLPSRWRPFMAIAAALTLFLAGFLAGRVTGPTPPQATPLTGPTTPPSGDRFLLLLYEGEDFAPRGSEADLTREYWEWWRANLQGPSGILWADRLGPGGTIVGPGGEEPGEFGPNGRLTRFFVVRVPNRDEAIRVAAVSPHVGYGGRVMVQPVE